MCSWLAGCAQRVRLVPMPNWSKLLTRVAWLSRARSSEADRVVRGPWLLFSLCEHSTLPYPASSPAWPAKLPCVRTRKDAGQRGLRIYSLSVCREHGALPWLYQEQEVAYLFMALCKDWLICTLSDHPDIDFGLEFR